MATKYRALLAQLSSSPFEAIWGVWGILGDLGTCGAKSDVRFLLGDPDFLYRRRNIALISLSYRDPYCGLFQGLVG